jgi:hypothetical protein
MTWSITTSYYSVESTHPREGIRKSETSHLAWQLRRSVIASYSTRHARVHAHITCIWHRSRHPRPVARQGVFALGTGRRDCMAHVVVIASGLKAQCNDVENSTQRA